ncbi:cutinase [Nocardia neocaledoniensis NBRC 108232]|uniref:Cutinase n=1 Tax=Nocardia neocaledoniensis TaxID=236511 RepID=A0A317N2K3_9NOCA|nr:cutinase family protein [Nocardia neocaledoniensis]PWV68884.1 cutinase [Nocardia neocaledoniensis]GEM34875.1 cutinase [Nocardia neocaledoniensis NBRC 108232]
MNSRKVISGFARRAARTLSVVLLAAGIGTATSQGSIALAHSCASIDVVIARGTQEPGYLGAAVGDPLYAVLSRQLPVDISAHRVEYPADLLVPSSVSDGTRAMTSHVLAQAAACPEQRFVLVGYSQGAVVTHGVLGSAAATVLPGIWVLPPELSPRIVAVLLFGDPLRLVGGTVAPLYADRAENYCTAGDPVCAGGVFPTAHGAYDWAFAVAAGQVGARL